MTNDQVFRWALAAGFLAVVAVTLPHRVKSATQEKLDRRKEGLVILATLRPAGAALWVGVIAWMINPASMAWSSMPLPDWVRWSGVLCCALSVALLVWTLPTLGTNLTDTVVTRQHHTLVTQGPYRWVRHPFYLAMALLTIGAALLSANWFVLLMGVVVFTLLAVRSHVEEEQLLARFGEPYRAYKARTGRFFPKL